MSRQVRERTALLRWTLVAHAVVDDCGFSGAALFDADGAASGSWSDATMWDTGAVPVAGQVCIPTGKIAVAGDNVSLGSQELRVKGTLRCANDVAPGI